MESLNKLQNTNTRIMKEILSLIILACISIPFILSIRIYEGITSYEIPNIFIIIFSIIFYIGIYLTLKWIEDIIKNK